MSHFVFQVQIRKCCSASWPTPKATGSTTSECLFNHYQDYKMTPHPLQEEIQATCVTWSLKSRLVIFRTRYIKHILALSHTFLMLNLFIKEICLLIQNTEEFWPNAFSGFQNWWPKMLTTSNPNSKDPVLIKKW